MKRRICILAVAFIFLLPALAIGAAASDETQLEDTEPRDFLDLMFLNLPESFGLPLYDLRRSIMKLTAPAADPALDPNFLAATEGPDLLPKTNPLNPDNEKFDPAALNLQFGPKPGAGQPLFEIGGYSFRGSLRLAPEYERTPLLKGYKPGEIYIPEWVDPAFVKFNIWDVPNLYKSVQTHLVITIEF